MVVRERQQLPASLMRLADGQAGVVTRHQATEHGLGRHAIRRLLSTGQWQALDRGIYQVTPQNPSWIARAWSGVLIGGDGSRVGGMAAAHLHGLVEVPPREITIWVSDDRRIASRPPWQFHRETGQRRPQSLGSPPRLCVEDTVIDLAEAGEPSRIPHWVSAAVQSRRSTVPRLRAVAEERQRLRHRRILTEILADVAEGAQTPLEIQYLKDVERAHGLPHGERQHRVHGSPYITDVWYRRFRLLAELDGRLGHEGPGAFRDLDRDNIHVLRGQATLRYGWHDVLGRPCGVAGQVGMILTRGGWRGTLVRCPRCGH